MDTFSCGAVLSLSVSASRDVFGATLSRLRKTGGGKFVLWWMKASTIVLWRLAHFKKENR